MEGKIFSFDLQRFDFAWSVGSGDIHYVYGSGAGSSIASLSSLSNNGWSLSASDSSGTISIAADDTTAAQSLVSASINGATARTIFDASSVALPFYFKFAAKTPITSITGGSSGASIDASLVKTNLTVIGGASADVFFSGSGADSFFGGEGNDTFVYKAGSDTIGDYTVGNDKISIATDSSYADLTKWSPTVSGSDLVLTYDNKNKMTFANQGSASVSVTAGSNTYLFAKDWISSAEESVSLTAGFTGHFSLSASSLSAFTTVDASKVTSAISIGGDSGATVRYIIGSNYAVTSIMGGSGADTLKAGTKGAYLNGGGGSDTLVGGNGKDFFIYGGSGTTSIQGYGTGGDVVSLTGSASFPLASAVSVGGKNNMDLILGFTGANSLTFIGGESGTFTILKPNGSNGNDTYYYSKDYISTSDYRNVSLTSNGSKTFTALGSNFSTKAVTIDAQAASVGSGVKVTLNNKNDYFIGGSSGNSITDGTGNDTVSLGSGADLFKYTGGADSIVGFGTGDSIKLNNSKLKLVTDGNYLKSLEGTGSKFQLLFDDKNANSLTFSLASANTAVSVYGYDNDATIPYEYTATAISIKGNNDNGSKVTLGSFFNVDKFDGSNFSVISAAAVTAGGSAGFSIKGGGTASNIYGSDNVFTSITGGTAADTLQAGKGDGTRGAYLSGGDGGNDLLIGNSAKDTFLYVSGADSIQSYTYGTDIVSLSGANLTVPTTFSGDSVKYGGSDFVVSLGGDNALTFKATQQFALQSVAASGGSASIYTFTPGSIALKIGTEDKGITLGPSYTRNFNGASDDNSGFESIIASEVTVANGIRVTGNSRPNYIVASSLSGGKLYGGAGNDTLVAGSVGAYMDGGDGDVLYIGSEDKTASIGADTFVYRGNAASIQNYNAGDIVNFSSRDITITDATISSESLTSNEYNISLNFGGTNDKIIFQNLTGTQADAGVSLQSGRNNTYVYKKDSVTWNGKSITLTADYAGNGTASMYAAPDDTLLATIDAHLVGQSIEGDNFLIKGNGNNNYIIGSQKANTIWGGVGNDTLVGNAASLDVFQYTEGKDVIIGFDGKDRFSIGGSYTANDITKAKTNRNSLTFTINNNKNNTIAFRSSDNVEVPEMVSLSGEGGGFLTASGVVSSLASGGDKYSLKLFGSAKGTIELANYTLTGGTVTSVNATAVDKQGLTLVAKSVTDPAYYDFYKGNKKRDTFEYNGGTVSISGFESGKDRLNIVDDIITSFSIHGGGSDKTGGDVIISLNGGIGTVSLNGTQGNEILVRANGARGYSKMVFRDAGVLENKTKNPTSVTISTGAASYSAANNTVKKMTVTDIGSAISIYAGAKGSIVDASNTLVGAGVSLIGGAKVDKFTGSAHKDTFIYDTSNGGKDIFNGFTGGTDSTSDAIEFSNGSASLLSDAKISASNKAVKFKFGKNVLTLKDDSIKGAKLQIDGTTYSYGKNAIINDNAASLTSAFGGTYKIADDISKVDGSLVKKNLTFKATSAGTDETLVGGTKKTTFKGAGGADSLVGGTGKDTFFYAKGDNGTATISNFDVENDKLKIAGGTLRKITVEGGKISFNMSRVNKTDDPEIGHFVIESFYNKDDSTTPTALDETKAKKTLIHANNKYYWFAAQNVTEEVTTEGGNGSTVTLAKAGELITWSDKKVSSSDAKGYDVIELNYGTNLVKSGVATMVSSKNTTGADLPSK